MDQLRGAVQRLAHNVAVSIRINTAGRTVTIKQTLRQRNQIHRETGAVWRLA